VDEKFDMVFGEFYEWLLKTNKPKAEKLKTAYKFTGIDLEYEFEIFYLADWIKNYYPLLIKDLINFVLYSDAGKYSWHDASSVYCLTRIGLMDVKEYLNFLETKIDDHRTEQVIHLLWVFNAITYKDVEELLNKILQVSDEERKSRTKKMIEYIKTD